MTRLPLPPRLGTPLPNQKDNRSENVEFSSREVKPTALLMQDLLRAHSIFLLHHAASLSALFVRSQRSRFVSILSRYWDLFLSTWDVMLHGNPATNVFGGIKIAACGELGVGVGEEDRGSGEREVLEGFVDRVEGLLDLVVSKFGPSESDGGEDPSNNPKSANDPLLKWLGTGEEPGAEDGAIFLGVGTLSKNSLRDITHWMEDIYAWGEDAYGVRDSPASIRQTRKSRKPSIKHTRGTSKVAPEAQGSIDTPRRGSQGQSSAPDTSGTASPSNGEEVTDDSGVNRFMSYFKMGYGTHWTLGGAGGVGPDGAALGDATKKDIYPSKALSIDSGQYLIGLLGDVDDTGTAEQDESREESDQPFEQAEYNSRVLLRTLTVELENGNRTEDEMSRDLGGQDRKPSATSSSQKGSLESAPFESQDRNKTEKVRVVVYVHKPFIYTFLFRNRTDSLAWDGLYRSLHQQLVPLRNPLATSTAYRPGRPDIGPVGSHIFDLIWDPEAMTVHSTIPSIPTLGQAVQENTRSVWSRIEAINTHNQILNTYIATLSNSAELERTCKTSRGWWIVWTRIMEKDNSPPPTRSHGSSDAGQAESLRHSKSVNSLSSRYSQVKDTQHREKVSKEIFLIRRAGEHTRLRGLSSSYAEGGGSWTEGASRLAQGIGVDTRKYIEGLLSLGR